jgi:hypothetical protein
MRTERGSRRAALARHHDTILDRGNTRVRGLVAGGEAEVQAICAQKASAITTLLQSDQSLGPFQAGDNSRPPYEQQWHP